MRFVEKSARFSFPIRLVAGIIVFIFTTTTITQAAPADLSIPRLQTVDQRLETSISSLVDQIAIPSEIGIINEIYKPEIGNTSRFGLPFSVSSLVVHIEDAHGSEEAQIKTERILNHLKDRYGFDTILLEGGFGELKPERLAFFKDEKLNQKYIDALTKLGFVGGVERFLSKQTAGQRRQAKDFKVSVASLQSVVYGVEDEVLYRKNLEVFRDVYGHKNETDRFLNEMRRKIMVQSSKVLNKELKDFFKAWIFQEEAGKDILSHLTLLEKYARDYLGHDFNDTRHQIEWPMLVRFFKIQNLQKLVARNSSLVESEIQKLKKWLIDHKLGTMADGFETFLVKSPAPSLESRSFFEEFYSIVAPKGFRFEDYPNLTRRIGVAILSSELQATDLFKEIEQLNEKVLEKLGKTTFEKEVIHRYQDYLLLKKLFALELSREEYRTIKEKRSAGNDQNRLLNAEHNPPGNGTVQDRVVDALRFYELAEAREKIMFEKMLRRMKSLNQPNAVLVTGGFHSEGLSQYFKDHQISFIRVTPRISKKIDGKCYLKLMTEQSRPGLKLRAHEIKDRVLAGSTIRQPTLLMGLGAIQSQLSEAMGTQYLEGLNTGLREVGDADHPFAALLRSLDPLVLEEHGLTVANQGLTFDRSEIRNATLPFEGQLTPIFDQSKTVVAQMYKQESQSIISHPNIVEPTLWQKLQSDMQQRYDSKTVVPLNYVEFPDSKTKKYYYLARALLIKKGEEGFELPRFNYVHLLAMIFYHLEHDFDGELPSDPEDRLLFLLRHYGIKNILEIGSDGVFENFLNDILKKAGGAMSTLTVGGWNGKRENGIDARNGDARLMDTKGYFHGKKFDLILNSGVLSLGGSEEGDPFDNAVRITTASLHSLTQLPKAAVIANSLRSHLLLEKSSVEKDADIPLWDNTISRHTYFRQMLQDRYRRYLEHLDPEGQWYASKKIEQLYDGGATAIILQPKHRSIHRAEVRSSFEKIDKAFGEGSGQKWVEFFVARVRSGEVRPHYNAISSYVHTQLTSILEDKAGQVSWEPVIYAVSKAVEKSRADGPVRSEVRSGEGSSKMSQAPAANGKIVMDSKALQRRINEIRSDFPDQNFYVFSVSGAGVLKITTQSNAKENTIEHIFGFVFGADKSIHMAVQAPSEPHGISYLSMDAEGHVEAQEVSRINPDVMDQLNRVQEGLQYRKLLQDISLFDIDSRPGVALSPHDVPELQEQHRIFFQYVLKDLERLNAGKNLFTTEEMARKLYYQEYLTKGKTGNLVQLMHVLVGARKKYNLLLADQNHPIWVLLRDAFKVRRILANLDTDIDPKVPSLGDKPKPPNEITTVSAFRDNELLAYRLLNLFPESLPSSEKPRFTPPSPRAANIILLWVMLNLGFRPVLRSEYEIARALKNVVDIQFIPSVPADPLGKEFSPLIHYPPRLKLVFNQPIVDPPAEAHGHESKASFMKELIVAFLESPLRSPSVDIQEIPNMVYADTEVQKYAFHEGMNTDEKFDTLKKLLTEVALHGRLFPESRQHGRNSPAIVAYSHQITRTEEEKQATYDHMKVELQYERRVFKLHSPETIPAGSTQQILQAFHQAETQIRRALKPLASKENLMREFGLDPAKSYSGLEGRMGFFTEYISIADHFFPVLGLLLATYLDKTSGKVVFLLQPQDMHAFRSKFRIINPWIEKASSEILKRFQAKPETARELYVALNLAFLTSLGMDSNDAFKTSDGEVLRDRLDDFMMKYAPDAGETPVFYKTWHGAVREFEKQKNLAGLEQKIKNLAAADYANKILKELTQAFEIYQGQVRRLIELSEIKRMNSPPSFDLSSQDAFVQSVEAIFQWVQTKTPRSELRSVVEDLNVRLAQFQRLIDFRKALETGTPQDSAQAYEALREDFPELRSVLYPLIQAHKQVARTVQSLSEAARPKRSLLERLQKEFGKVPPERQRLFEIPEQMREIYMPVLGLFLAMQENPRQALITQKDFGRFSSGTSLFPPLKKVLDDMVPATEKMQSYLDAIPDAGEKNRFLIALNVAFFKRMGLDDQRTVKETRLSAVRTKFFDFLKEYFDPSGQWPNADEWIQIGFSEEKEGRSALFKASWEDALSGHGGAAGRLAATIQMLKTKKATSAANFRQTILPWVTSQEYLASVERIAEVFLATSKEQSAKELLVLEKLEMLVALMEERGALQDVDSKKKKLYEAGRIYEAMVSLLSETELEALGKFVRNGQDIQEWTRRNEILKSFLAGVEGALAKDDLKKSKSKLEAAKAQPIFPGMDEFVLGLQRLEEAINLAGRKAQI
ncbi:MAG TPA: hypothetical protein PLO78_07890, partial [Candidatus Omnitrophota bacterium]|nr:hypothetical protein [Candidatus Omnitrophota bacterium]